MFNVHQTRYLLDSQMYILQRIREIPPDVESILFNSKQAPVVKTEWNIPETVINPSYEPQPGEEHFYSS